MARSLRVAGLIAALCVIVGGCGRKDDDRPVDTTLEEPAQAEPAAVATEDVATLDPMGPPADYEDFDGDGGSGGGGRSGNEDEADQASAYADAPTIVRNKPELLSRAFADDYPARAAREEREGRVEILVGVSPQGRVSDCVVAASSGSADLDEAACSSAFRRARYRPATDAGGVPMATANVREAVTYKLN